MMPAGFAHESLFYEEVSPKLFRGLPQRRTNAAECRSWRAGTLGFWLLLIYLLFGFGLPVWAGGGFLQIRNGYFWDPVAVDYFMARGIAYQTWNPPVGADQSFAQLDYDLVEFKRLHANSVRAEMGWDVIE